MVTVTITETFEKEVRKIRDETVKEKVRKHIEKIVEHPDIGKPLRYTLKGERTVRIPPYRIIYTFRQEEIILLRFQHRKEVYE